VCALVQLRDRSLRSSVATVFLWISKYSRSSGAIAAGGGRKLAESLQLLIDPQPPFDTGAAPKADASTLRLAFWLMLADRPLQMTAA
jgi:hypothetical protein